MSTGGGQLLGVSVLELRTDDRQLKSGMAEAERTADASGARVAKTFDKHMQSVGQSMSRVGGSLSRNVTLPIVAGLGAASDAAIHFEQKMELVRTQAGASQREVNNLSKEILAFAQSGKAAQGPSALADALFRLEGAGYHGAAAMKALKEASDLAAVGNANVEDTAKTLTQVLKPGIKGIADFQSAVAQINATVGAGDLRLQPLVDALGTGVVTAAKNAGLSFQDVTGALAVFGDETNNVPGWAAQLATAFHFMTNPTQKAQDALASIGLQADSLSKDMDKPQGLLTALRDLKSHLDQLPKDKAKQVLGDILPGGRGRVLAVLLNQTDLLAQKMQQIAHTSGDFEQSVAVTQQTAAFKIHAAWAQIQADGIQLGDVVLPKLLTAGHDVLQEGEKVASAFFKLPKGAQDAIITGGLLTAGLGPALKVLGLFSGVIGKAWQLGAIVGKVGMGQGANAFRSGAGGAVESALGQITGVRGAGVGSAANPMVVTLEAAQYTNLGSRAAAIGTTGATESLAAGETRSPGGVILPRGVQSSAGTLTAAEETASLGVLGTLKSGASTALARGMQGLLIGSLGTVASQAIGSAVHGGVGKAIKDIGTDASIGAGLGAFFGPEGIAGGAIVGGLVGTFKELFKGHGQEIADSITKGGFGGAVADSLNKQIASLINQGDKLSKPKLTGPTHDNLGNILRPQLQGPSQADLDKAKQAYMKAGQLVAQQLQAGWNQFRFESEPIMLRQFSDKIKGLPKTAQLAAVQSVVKFSQSLESKGRLAKGSTAQLISDIESEFPKLVNYMGLSAGASTQAFTRALNFNAAEQNTRTAMTRISNDFAIVREAMTLTKGSTMDKAGAMIQDLMGIATYGTGPMAAQAKKDLATLKTAIKDTFEQSGALVDQKMHDISGAVKSGSQSAAHQAQKYWSQYVGTIKDAEKAGALTVAEGNKLIAAQLQKALEAMGVPAKDAKQLAKSGYSVGEVSSAIASASSVGLGNGPGQFVYAVGGVVDRPMVMVGEEAPTHKEFVLATNPAYRPRNLGLWAQAGRELGVPGFAQGGVVSYGQLEGAWDQAGGPPQDAALAAAIAEAESRGQLDARNPSGASGAWQILGQLVPGNIFDLMVNARNAVAKWRGAGGSFTPWVTFTSGAYKQFLNGNVAAAGGIGAEQITAPKVKGDGLIAALAQGALDKIASGANTFLSSQTPAIRPGTTGPSGGGFDPSQLTTFDGIRVARWIANELGYARGHGWTGPVTSGYRAGFDPHTVNGFSEHSLDIYPGGAVDFGGMIDPAAAANRAAFMAAAAGYTGERLILPMGFRDDGHMSGTGHKTGGIIGFKQGGVYGPQSARPTGSTPRKQKPFPKPKRPPLFVGLGNSVVDYIDPKKTDLQKINGALGQLDGILGNDGSVNKLSDLLSYWQQSWAIDPGQLTYVVSQDANGNPVTPFVDQGAVNQGVSELQQQIGWESQIIADLNHAMMIARAVIVAIKKAIAKRKHEIAKRQAKIKANLRKISALQKLVDGEKKKKHPSKTLVDGWDKSMRSLKDENQKLGGDRTKVGTGGEIAPLNAQIQNLQSSLTTAQGYPDQIAGAGASGFGGQLGPAKIAEQQLEQSLGALSPGALSKSLAQATASAGATASGDLTSLLDQYFTSQAQSQAVFSAELRAFNLPPFGGTFHSGGVVPGPVGAERMALVQAGERISPIGGDGATIENHLHFAPGTEWLRDFVRVETKQTTRTMARNAARNLPGAGGGRF